MKARIKNMAKHALYKMVYPEKAYEWIRKNVFNGWFE